MSLSTRVIGGLGEIAAQYESYILDLWGCLHNGVTAYPAALDALRNLHKAGKRIVILSNAPRRAYEVAARMAELGIEPGLYDRIYTSGEETWRALSQGGIADLKRAARFYAIIAKRDRAVLENVTATQVDDVSKADFILVTGTETGVEEPASFDPILRIGARRGLPLICANPDLVVHRGSIEEYCAGSIAQRYEGMGGKVIWFGKPYPAIYRRILEECDLEPADVLGVGDALRTDVAGGAGVGAATLFIAGGIHHAELLVDGKMDLASFEAVCRALSVTPNFAIPFLRW
jgi:HAD superfamily hydrolase (TIGR01459 family)